MADLVIALRELYKNKPYRDRILDILESKLIQGKPRTGRPGMDLWRLFVPAQLRLSKQLSYMENSKLFYHWCRGIIPQYFKLKNG
jgi:hypothetical protein